MFDDLDSGSSQQNLILDYEYGGSIPRINAA
jgi:hypothetical protein